MYRHHTRLRKLEAERRANVIRWANVTPWEAWGEVDIAAVETLFMANVASWETWTEADVIAVEALLMAKLGPRILEYIDRLPPEDIAQLVAQDVATAVKVHSGYCAWLEAQP